MYRFNLIWTAQNEIPLRVIDDSIIQEYCNIRHEAKDNFVSFKQSSWYNRINC